MKEVIGKVFRHCNGSEYGVIREPRHPYPADLADRIVLAEDDCGNYFLKVDNSIVFWDHELNEELVLASNIHDFVSKCKEPAEVALKPGQVKATWIDPEFAKEHEIDKEP